MSELKIQRAFENRLLALDPVFPTEFENQKFEPKNGVAYQSTKLFPSQPENPTLGDDYYREVGFFQINLFYPANDSIQPARAKADAIKQHFKRGTFITQEGQVIKITRTPTAATSIPNGDWVVIPITIFYSSEIFEA